MGKLLAKLFTSNRSWSILWCDLKPAFLKSGARLAGPIRWVLIAGLAVTGCGYQFSVDGAGPTIGGGAPLVSQGPPVRVAMRTFKNQSFEPTLEFKYTQYVRRALQSGGLLKSRRMRGLPILFWTGPSFRCLSRLWHFHKLKLKKAGCRRRWP